MGFPPFEPVERNGLVVRPPPSTADDKAGIATHLAAFRSRRPASVGVTVFVEGRRRGFAVPEQIVGRPQDKLYRRRHRDRRFRTIGQPDPRATVSLRGLADCVVEVATLDHGLHSGL